jgi:hypothetical protein
MCRFFYRLFIYVLPFEIQLLRGRVFKRFNHDTFFVPVSSQNLDLQCHMSCLFHVQ